MWQSIQSKLIAHFNSIDAAIRYGKLKMSAVNRYAFVPDTVGRIDINDGLHPIFLLHRSRHTSSPLVVIVPNFVLLWAANAQSQYWRDKQMMLEGRTPRTDVMYARAVEMWYTRAKQSGCWFLGWPDRERT